MEIQPHIEMVGCLLQESNLKKKKQEHETLFYICQMGNKCGISVYFDAIAMLLFYLSLSCSLLNQMMRIRIVFVYVLLFAVGFFIRCCCCC